MTIMEVLKNNFTILDLFLAIYSPRKTDQVKFFLKGYNTCYNSISNDEIRNHCQDVIASEKINLDDLCLTYWDMSFEQFCELI